MTDEELRKQAEDNIKSLAIQTAQDAIAKANFASKEDTVTKADLTAEVQKLQAEVKKARQMVVMPAVKMSNGEALLNELSTRVLGNKDVIKSFDDGSVTVINKTAGNISPASFGTGAYAAATEQSLEPYRRTPTTGVYLRAIFPNISTNAGTLNILKQGTNDGAAAIWERGTGSEDTTVDKPLVELKFVKQAVTPKWIAGIAHVEREVLDDVDFLATEIPYQLVYGAQGVLAAENGMILDYITNASNYTAYSGTGFGSKLEDILAAAHGQIGGAGMQATHVVMNPWDYVKYVAFAKAAGSGEYITASLNPQLIQGQLYFGTLQAVAAPGLASGSAYVIAANECRFVSRADVQFKMFLEHADNVTKNMVTFRAEERAAFFSYAKTAIVKVTLA